MSGATRIGAFVLVLAAAFLAAAAVGRGVGPIEREVDGEGHEEAEAMAMELAEPAGLAVAADGLRLAPNRTDIRPRVPTPFAFRIVRDDGRPLLNYDVEHERRMHLIVVRRDLTEFQHLHPDGPRGDWVTTLHLERPGIYRVFADFATRGARKTLGVDLTVPGSYRPRPLPEPARIVSAGPYAVELLPTELHAGRDATLRFDVRRAGRAAAVAPYLGARGHLVALREGDLAYLHNHAEEDELAFETTFPSPGRYRLFLQFRAGGEVRTAALAVEVPS